MGNEVYCSKYHRQRKYRFWDLEGKQMIYPEEKSLPNLMVDVEGQIFESNCVVWDDLSKTNKFVQMDWLGITDKNNKDIYELDWVKFYGNFYGKKENRILLIRYSPRNAKFLFSDHLEDKKGWSLSFDNKAKYYDGNKAKFLEIIGTFFENPGFKSDIIRD